MLNRKLKSPLLADIGDPETYRSVSTELRQGLIKGALAAVIALEKETAVSDVAHYPEQDEIRTLADRILDGYRPAVPGKRGSLRQARAIYAAAQLAEQLAGERAAALALAFAHREADRRASEWQANRHALAVALCVVRKLESEGAQLAKDIRGKTMLALPCEVPPILAGAGRSAGAAREFLKASLRRGIITMGELARELGKNERVVKDEFGV